MGNYQVLHHFSKHGSKTYLTFISLYLVCHLSAFSFTCNDSAIVELLLFLAQTQDRRSKKVKDQKIMLVSLLLLWK